MTDEQKIEQLTAALTVAREALEGSQWLLTIKCDEWHKEVAGQAEANAAALTQLNCAEPATGATTHAMKPDELKPTPPQNDPSLCAYGPPATRTDDLAQLRAELARIRAEVEAAPHEYFCQQGFNPATGEYRDCTCFKSRIL